MTDKTQPEALRTIKRFYRGTDCMAENQAGDWVRYEDHVAAATELRRQHARIAELEAQLEAVGAGGVQALSAAPAGWKLVPVEPSVDQEWKGKEASLRVDSMAEACKIYKAMLAASPTPPAEQQVITPETGNSVSAQGAAITSESGAVYAELPDPGHRGPVGTGSYFDSFTRDQMRDFADRTHELRQQAAPKAAPGEQGYREKWDAELGRTAMRFVDRAGDVHPGIDDAETICAEFHKAMSEVIERMPHVQRMAAPKAAPQQEAQERATVPRFNCWSTNEGDSWFDHPADSQAIYDCLGNDAKVGDEYELTAGWKSVTARYRITEVVGDGEEYEVECISHPQGKAAPQPAPAPLSGDAKDAARYRWLRNKSTVLHGTAWLGSATAYQRDVGFLRRDDALAALDAAIDAALGAQGGKV